MRRENLGVAQFGSVLEWGSRGRKFESSHSDQNPLKQNASADFFVSPLPHNSLQFVNSARRDLTIFMQRL